MQEFVVLSGRQNELPEWQVIVSFSGGMWWTLFQLVGVDVQVTHDRNQKSVPKSLVWTEQEKHEVERQTVSYKWVRLWVTRLWVCTNKTEKDDISGCGRERSDAQQDSGDCWWDEKHHWCKVKTKLKEELCWIIIVCWMGRGEWRNLQAK